MYREAGRQLPYILELIPTNEEVKYGFKDRNEFQRAVVGVPYQEYSLSDDAAGGSWRVAVSVDGVNKILMRMKMVDGKWAAVGLSGAGLANELGVFETNHNESKPSWGRIVRDYDMCCDYVQMEPKEHYGLTGIIHPMESAVRTMLKTTDTIKKNGYTVREIKEFRRTGSMKGLQPKTAE